MIKAFFRLIKFIILVGVIVIGVNIWVVMDARGSIMAEYKGPEDVFTQEEIARLKSIDPTCIMVLGASVNPDGTPSPMLQDRLDTAIALYNSGVSSALLLSGDSASVEYDEVTVMKSYAMQEGVPEEDIFLDHTGLSTYDSVYRAGDIFCVESMIVVTQEYHLYRALYGCDEMGITAVGVVAEQDTYAGHEKREIREVLARSKDFIKWYIKPEPTFMGERIPIE